MSMLSGSSLIAMPASARAFLRGCSEIGKTTASGWFALSHRTVVTTVLAISSIGVGMPSFSSFST